jgi:hypothetical protein
VAEFRKQSSQTKINSHVDALEGVHMPTQTTEPPGAVTSRLLRALMALSLACAFGIFAFAAAIGFTGSKLVAAIVAVGIAAFVAWFFWWRPIVPLDEGGNSRALNVISGLATLGGRLRR